MTEDEKANYMQRYMARWRRWLVDLSWANGPMTVWKPVLSEQQKQAHDQYVIDHKLPF